MKDDFGHSGSLMAAVGADLEAENTGAAYIDGISLMDVSEQAVTWLDANPPAACYRTIWQKARSFFSNTDVGMWHLTTWLLVYPYGSQVDANLGLAALKEANSSAKEFNILVDRSDGNPNFCMVPIITTS